MAQNFKKHFIYLNKSKFLSSKQLYNHILDSIQTVDDPDRFQQLADLIFSHHEILGEEKLKYLRQLFQIKEKWTSAH